MKKLSIFVWVVILLVVMKSSAYARSGCCSHHGGVSSDGCGCNDGTPLSNTCAPYYSCTANTYYQAPIIQNTEIPIVVPTKVTPPTSTPLSYLSPSQQPPLIIQHQTTITQPSISPDTVLQTYYNWYLACQNYHFANANVGTVNKSPQEDCPYNKTGLLTGELASTLQQAIALDPVLCAQNRPMEVTYDKAVVINTHATAIVHTVWGASRKQNISVGMDVQNGAWKISSITCPQS